MFAYVYVFVFLYTQIYKDGLNLVFFTKKSDFSFKLL